MLSEKNVRMFFYKYASEGDHYEEKCENGFILNIPLREIYTRKNVRMFFTNMPLRLILFLRRKNVRIFFLQ